MDDTKTELFKYLAEQTIAIQDEGEELVSTSDFSVLTNSKENTACISSCSHEEADTSLLLHAFDSGKEGCRKVMLRTIDTEEELWIAFGAGKAFRCIAIYEINAIPRQGKCEALPFFPRSGIFKGMFCSLICIKSRNNHNIAEIYRKALKLGHPIELDDLSSFSV